MTTKAIEAGARADRIARLAWPDDFDRMSEGEQSECVGDAKRVIEAAIASGELVPASGGQSPAKTFDKIWNGLEEASAVAAERERCAKVAEKGAAEIEAVLERQVVRDAPRAKECAVITAKAAREIAAAIRALEPASGEYVLVPREPTREQLDVLSVVCRETWGVNVERKRPMPFYTAEWRERMKPIYRAMLTAATSNGSDPT